MWKPGRRPSSGGERDPKPCRFPAVFTTEQLRSLVDAYNAKHPGNAITLGSNASQWIKILSTDPYGYVLSIQISNRTFTGNNVSMDIFRPANLRSHNFTFTFTAG